MAAIETMFDGVEEVEAAWEKAKTNERWLVAIWSVSPEGELTQQITTWDFPRGDIATATHGIQNFARNERSAPRPMPLPPADPKELFEDLQEGE